MQTTQLEVCGCFPVFGQVVRLSLYPIPSDKEKGSSNYGDMRPLLLLVTASLVDANLESPTEDIFQVPKLA